MVVHKQVETAGIHFNTSTFFRWMHCILKTNASDAVYNFFSILNQRGHQVYDYSILPNQKHLRFSTTKLQGKFDGKNQMNMHAHSIVCV